MAKCRICGKELGFLQSKQIYDEETESYKTYCNDCYNLPLEEKKKEEKRIMKEEWEHQLSLPELQLQEIMQMKKDVATIKNIMLFFLILFIILLLIILIPRLLLF